MPDRKAEHGKRTEKLQLMLNDAELEAIEEWRFSNRLPSRAAAIRELIRRGLRAQDDAGFDSHAQSGDYGIVDD